MNEMNRVGNHYFHAQGYVFEVEGKDRSEVTKHEIDTNWEDRFLTYGEFQIIPHGDHNDRPEEVRDTVSAHNLAPRIFTKRKFLTWGQGPALYREQFTGGDDSTSGVAIQRVYTRDPQIMRWLESWQYDKYLLRAIEDYNYMEGHFTKVKRARGLRIGRPAMVAELEHVPNLDCRFAGRDLLNHEPTHIGVSRWKSQWVHNIQRYYPICDLRDPVKHSGSILYSSLNAFGRRYYAEPDVLGSLPWLRRATDVPFVLEALTKNSLHIKWHIISPAKYWQQKENQLRAMCAESGQLYKAEMLEKLKDDIFSKLGKVLGGRDNVGKFWASESIKEIIGNSVAEHKWEIIPIDQKIKDFVESQIKISERTDFTTVAGLGLHQALSNIAASGKSDSGSEQLYAYKNYMLSEVNLPERIICEAINMAIKVNWPDKDLKLGFYRQLPEREEDITNSKRITNAVE